MPLTLLPAPLPRIKKGIYTSVRKAVDSFSFPYFFLPTQDLAKIEIILNTWNVEAIKI